MLTYNITDRQIHWLSQVLAKANRAYVPEQKDDSHTNLYFDALEKRILGRWIDGPGGKIIPGLNLQSLSFQWLDIKQNVLHEVSVLNKSMEQLEKSVNEYPMSINMGRDTFFQALHFEIPDYKIETLNRGDISEDGIRSWIYFRDLANRASLDMLGYLQLESEIRIWPHHFDTGIYTRITEEFGLGFGLAMEDSMIGRPYFYMSGYNGESPISYKNLNRLSTGRWETGEHWNGAVLALNGISATSIEDAIKTIQAFIKETASWFINN